MPRHESLWLEDIREAAHNVAAFIEGYTFETFVADAKTRSAVLYQLIIIGEAASRLSTDLRGRHPSVNWRPVVGFRNRAIHEYFGGDWAIVWDTATKNVPALAPQIAAILEQEFPDADEQ